MCKAIKIDVIIKHQLSNLNSFLTTNKVYLHFKLKLKQYESSIFISSMLINNMGILDELGMAP